MYERDKDRYHKQMKEYIQSNNLEPPPVTNPTPLPPTDTVVRTDSVTNGKSIPSKEPPAIKTEPTPETDHRDALSTSAPSAVTNTVTNTVRSTVKKPEITVHMKREVKAESFAQDRVTQKLKNSFHLKPMLEGDDPYHFDDD